MTLESENLLNGLAASLTPTTLAAVIGDLEENDALTDYLAGLMNFAKGKFREQLVCMVGEAEAENMLDPTVPCDGCGRGEAKIGGHCSHCGELIECDCRS